MTLTRRQSIMLRAAQLFAERGVAATSIREIADAVELNAGTLYHYFASKDALVSEILTDYLEDLMRAYEQLSAERETDPRTRLETLVAVTLRVAAAHPYATEIYQNERALLPVLPGHASILASIEESHRVWASIVSAGVRAGTFRDDIPAAEFERILREALWLEIRWHRGTLPNDIERMSSYILDIFLDGFTAPAAKGSTAGARTRRRH